MSMNKKIIIKNYRLLTLDYVLLYSFLIINNILRKVENNQIQSLKFYKLPFIFNLGKAEIKMGKEKSDNSFERLYIVTFKTI